MRWHEVNFDGLVGPTHHYAGLAAGNLAATQHAGRVSYPRQAALQGLAKMRLLMQHGVVQAVWPPQCRPNRAMLTTLGFLGAPEAMLARAWQTDPRLLALACSASSMWVANAATVAPSCDTADHKLLVLPANLVSNAHRHGEVAATVALLNYVFSDTRHFRVQEPLPFVAAFADEGAANHMRIGLGEGRALHVLVYGTDDGLTARPEHFPARQSRAASEAFVRAAGFSEQEVVLVQQHPDAIDAGVFHNDVIALSHDRLLLCHERAFYQQDAVLSALRHRGGDALTILEVSEAEVPLALAVQSYLFNSQILGPEHRRWMLLPSECRQNKQVHRYVEQRLAPALSLHEVAYVDLQQSMHNGGGPACLRLRVTMNEDEIQALQGRLMLDEAQLLRLEQLVSARYPTTLTLAQLAQGDVAREMWDIVAEIYELLALPTTLLEPFQ